MPPYYAFLLFVGERNNWDVLKLSQYFGERDLRKAIHVLKLLLPFIHIPGIDDEYSGAKIDAKKRAALRESTFESVRDIAKRLREEGKRKREEARRREEEKKARKRAEKEAEKRERKQYLVDKNLIIHLKNLRDSTGNKSIGKEAVALRHGTDLEKEEVRKKYAEKIKEIKKELKIE